MNYVPKQEYTITVKLDVNRRFFDVFVNGEKRTGRMFFNPVHSLARITFRTGEVRRFPNADTPTDQDFDVPNDGQPVKEAIFYVKSLKTE